MVFPVGLSNQCFGTDYRTLVLRTVLLSFLWGNHYPVDSPSVLITIFWYWDQLCGFFLVLTLSSNERLGTYYNTLVH